MAAAASSFSPASCARSGLLFCLEELMGCWTGVVGSEWRKRGAREMRTAGTPRQQRRQGTRLVFLMGFASPQEFSWLALKRQSAEGYLSFLPVCPPRPSNASTGSYTSAGGTHKIRGLSFSLRVKTRSCHCAGGETRCILAASLEGKAEDSGSEPRRRRGWQRHPPA